MIYSFVSAISLLCVLVGASSEDSNYPWLLNPLCLPPRATFDPSTLKELIPQHNQLTSAPIPWLADFLKIKSWSQAGEDHAIYRRFFSDKKFVEKGFFLEIGGLDGATFSNTFLFEQSLGWNGMLIEGTLFQRMDEPLPLFNLYFSPLRK